MSAMPPEYYMKLALQEAEKAYQADEVPVGAVIVMQDTVIAKGYNQVELLQEATMSNFASAEGAASY